MNQLALTEKERKILKACDEEPDTFENFSNIFKISQEELNKTLLKLQRLGLVYNNERFWCSTLEGSKRLVSS